MAIGVRITSLQLNATWDTRFTQVQQSSGLNCPCSRKKQISCVSFMPLIDVDSPEHRGRFATKGVGWLPCWDVSVSPLRPTTHCHNTSEHQGAFALFRFHSLSLSLSLSLGFSSHKSGNASRTRVCTKFNKRCAVWSISTQLQGQLGVCNRWELSWSESSQIEAHLYLPKDKQVPTKTRNHEGETSASTEL